MTDLDRLRDAVVQAARRLANIPGIELQAEGAEEAFSALDDALAALDAAQSRPREAETVTLGLMHSRTRGDYMACAAPEQEDPSYWVHVGNITFVPPVAPPIPTIAGTVTLPLDGKPGHD